MRANPGSVVTAIFAIVVTLAAVLVLLGSVPLPAEAHVDPLTNATDLIDFDAPFVRSGSIDAGLRQRDPVAEFATISGFTFEQTQVVDGTYDLGWDFPLAGVVVNLRDINDVIVATATTNSNDVDGYEFTEVPPGTYVVEFELPQARSFAPKDQAWYAAEPDAESDLIDSDADPETGRTDPITVGAGDVVEAVSAGFGPRLEGSFDGWIWLDANANGIQDPGEVGIAGVGIELFAYLGQSGIGFVETDEFGRYSFENVQEGWYDLNVFFPDEFEATKWFVGDDRSVDSELVYQQATSVGTDGLAPTTVDGGLVPRVLLGDVNCDGVINIIDALWIARYDISLSGSVQSCMRYEPADSVIAVQNGDVNADGNTNIIDALLIAQCDALLTNVFCPDP